MKTKKSVVILAVVVVVLLVVAYLTRDTKPGPVINVKQVYTYYFPLVHSSGSVSKKRVAGFVDDAAALASYSQMGVGGGYNWGHVCTQAQFFLSLECENHLRSNATKTWNSFVDDCIPNSTEEEVRACVVAKARTRPGQIWLIGNEPDGGDPSASDLLSPADAATKYGELIQTVKFADPAARIYCCGWITPFYLSNHASEFITAYSRVWGHPFSDDVMGIHFHVYSIIGSTCSPSDDVCLQTQFQRTLDSWIGWRNAALPLRPIRVTEFNWTPFPSQQTPPLMASRLPAVCRSLYAAGVEAFNVFYGVSVSEAQWYPNLDSFVLMNSDRSLTAPGSSYSSCNPQLPPYP